MDLRIIITDENSEVLEDITVYQDGSDIEGARDIVRLIGDRYEVEDD